MSYRRCKEIDPAVPLNGADLARSCLTAARPPRPRYHAQTGEGRQSRLFEAFSTALSASRRASLTQRDCDHANNRDSDQGRDKAINRGATIIIVYARIFFGQIGHVNSPSCSPREITGRGDLFPPKKTGPAYSK